MRSGPTGQTRVNMGVEKAPELTKLWANISSTELSALLQNKAQINESAAQPIKALHGCVTHTHV